MIRHLAELSALLLCFAVGIGLIGAFVIGLLWIWRPAGYEAECKWLDPEEPFAGDAAWPAFRSAFPFDWERD